MKIGVVPVTAYQQNCSILWCEKTMEGAIVDPGGDIPKIRNAIEQTGIKPKYILITHGHLDHAGAAAELARLLDIEIIGPHKEDSFWIDQLPATCQAMGFAPSETFTPSRWLNDGDTVEIGDVCLDVVFCPGHTPGHVVFVNKKERLAIVGDVLFQGSIGRTDFPRGDHATLIDSIKNKLFPLGDDITFIPGHGPSSTFGHERATNPFVGSQYG
jgi:glyoxylase-like metal-dependent hydrolase (beta-lactamase superfamily II)